MRLYTCLSLFVLLASSAPSFAAPLTDGNILVANGDKLTEYTTAGALVQTIPVPSATGGSDQIVRDLVVDHHGRIHVMTFPGTFLASTQAYLSTYDQDTELWTHNTIDGWSLGSVTYFGGIGGNGNYIFGPDQDVGGGARDGVIRFPLSDLSAPERFHEIPGSGQAIWHYTIVGLDGIAYAMNRDGALHGYNPNTMVKVKDLVNVYHESSVVSFVVDKNGDIWHTDLNSNLTHTTPTGALIEVYDVTGGGDLSLYADGTLLIASAGESITITNIHDLENEIVIDTLAQDRNGVFDLNFVTFTGGEPVPEPSSLVLAGLGGLGLIGLALRRRKR